MKEKVLLVGDTHGNIELINMAINIANKRGCNKILQLGDFGFFPNIYPEFIDSLDSNIPFFFIDGNHDNHFVLPHNANHPVSLSSLGYSSNNFFYIPRGYYEQWGDSYLLFIGGARSIDKVYRTLGIDYFDNEEISYKDFLECMDYPEVDVIISHTCPYNIEINYIESNDYSSKVLSELIDIYHPKYLIHGHHHINYELTLNEGTIIKGLGCSLSDMFQVIYF